jgi:hypothetical protein
MLKRKITFCSHKHSFTPSPSLSPYRQADRMTDRKTNKEIVPIFLVNTLLLNIPLLALTHRQIDRQTDRETN